MIELNVCYSILLIHSPLIILPTFHSCIFVITYYLIYYVLHILLSTINLCTIYSSEIAISQVPDGASLILLFEHTLACSTMRNDLLGLQYSLIYLLSIRHRQCLHTENLRSKELELF